MTEVNHANLVTTLTRSYSEQIVLYRKLTEVVQKILSRVVLSRGNMSGVMDLFGEKQDLLEQITKARMATADQTDLWQREKANMPANENTRRLDDVLGEAQKAIGAFLDGEEQLKKYLEHLTGRNEETGE